MYVIEMKRPYSYLSDSEKLEFLVDNLCGGKYVTFANKTGISADYVSKIRRKRIYMRTMYDKILAAFPMVNREWLYTGLGFPGMLNVELTKEYYQGVISKMQDTIDALTKEVALQQRIITEMLDEKEGIPTKKPTKEK